MARIKANALTSVKLLSDVKEVNIDLLKIIDKNAVNLLPEEKISIYNFEDQLLYCSVDNPPEITNKDLLHRIKAEKEVQYTSNDRETVGFIYEGKNEKFIAIASAYDKTGFEKLDYLRKVYVIRFFIALAIVVVIGLFFSKQALSPLTDIVKQIDRITASNLKLKLNEGNQKDEISQLAIKFNKMLERLEDAFEMQRSFVSNASHELRTPLTTLTGQLEVALMNKDKSEPWEVLKNLLDEIKQLNKLSNGLLELAQANLDISELKIAEVRVDELVGSARAELLKRNRSYKLNLNIDEFPDEKWLTLLANEQLLRTALINIMENGCKYSENTTSEITLKFDLQNVIITISDKGIGINKDDLHRIFEPFYRSKNAKNYKGHGIGLTLAKKIIYLHKGSLKIQSVVNQGTSVEITIPHL